MRVAPAILYVYFFFTGKDLIYVSILLNITKVNFKSENIT